MCDYVCVRACVRVAGTLTPFSSLRRSPGRRNPRGRVSRIVIFIRVDDLESKDVPFDKPATCIAHYCLQNECRWVPRRTWRSSIAKCGRCASQGEEDSCVTLDSGASLYIFYPREDIRRDNLEYLRLHLPWAFIFFICAISIRMSLDIDEMTVMR